MPGAFKETILVVDDNEFVLTTVAKILAAAGFHVLSAGDGVAALKLAGETEQHIDLLLSDVDMPGMSGPDLGEALKKERPDIHVMLMSGGSNGNLLVLNYGWAYIQKPFLAVKAHSNDHGRIAFAQPLTTRRPGIRQPQGPSGQ